MLVPSKPMNHVELTDGEYHKYCELIYRVAGIRIADNKRVMVSNRVRRRLKATGISDFTEYFAFLTSPAGGDEMPLFLDAITTNETYFFRDTQNYDWLGNTFLPEIIYQAKSRKRPKTLRIWSAACSTGEEPYSVALKVLATRSLFAGWRTTILGTDLSGAVLNAARAGCYDARAIRLIEPALRATYFDEEPTDQQWIAKPEVKALVTWKQHNLLFPLEEDPFDCIFLKNVLIYFDTESKQSVVKNVIDSLAKGGYLVVGPTEGIYMMLDPLTKLKPWLYQRQA
jgi:chemotaxis protein methyltransferase CheR